MQYALFYIDFFVNNIQKNHHLTALNGDFIIVCVTFLIMLSIGLSPFLLMLMVRSLSVTSCVNALYRAFSISTHRGSLAFCRALCQCPLSGFLHFYNVLLQDNFYLPESCQCPLSGFLHFYAPPWERPKMKHLQTRFCR